MRHGFCIAALLSSILHAVIATVTPVTIKGNAFYQGQTRFYIRGIDYAPGNGVGLQLDPLANLADCQRDLAHFQDLGINTIRVYAVDNTKDHDECMAALADAGIYVALDVNNAHYSLNRDDIGPSYNEAYLQSVFATVDAFAKYDNTLLFLSGNEIINAPGNTHDAPTIKAVTRDVKAYIVSMKYRAIPVGYSAADVDQNQLSMAQYMSCDGASPTGDFYAINDYSWCQPSSFANSGWPRKVGQYANYGIPLFLSEFGCITNGRTFEEVIALYTPQMTGVFSGGLVYEYSHEGNGYGLVNITSDGKVVTTPDYDALKKAYGNAPVPTDGGGARVIAANMSCPLPGPNWDVSSNAMPAMPAGAQKFMGKGAGKGPGFVGSSQPGNPGPAAQDAASTSTSLTTTMTTTASMSTATTTTASNTSTTKMEAAATTTAKTKSLASQLVPQASEAAQVLFATLMAICIVL